MLKTTAQKYKPLEISNWYKIRNKFGATRPTTTLTQEAWPNRSNGPPCSAILGTEEGDGFINDISHAPIFTTNALNWVIKNSNRTEIAVTIGTLETGSLSSSGATRMLSNAR